MTLKLVDGQTQYMMSFNIANASGDWTLTVTSQLSHLNILDEVPLTKDLTNDRYTEFTFNIPSELPQEHKNGIYDYSVTNGTVTFQGLLKLVCGTGGTNGTVNYESDNEDRQGPVYYTPEY